MKVVFSGGFLTIGLILCILSSCVEKKMTLEQAKQVSVSMRQVSFVPPPRSIEDILSVLDQAHTFDKQITDALRAKADELPPDTDDPAVLAVFYRKRGGAANELGRAGQELSDKRQALAYAETTDKIPSRQMSNLLKSLASAEVKLGNFRTGQALCKQGIRISPSPYHYILLATTLFKMGDFEQGSQAVQAGIALCNRISRKAGGKGLIKIQAARARLNALHFSSRGMHKKAEKYWREYQSTLASLKAKKPSAFIMSHLNLAKNLKSQGRLIEAELMVRKGLKLAVAHSGRYSSLTGSMTGFFGEILLKQGRLSDARKMLLASIDAYEKAGVSHEATSLAKVRVRLGEVMFAKRDFTGALGQFNAIEQDMAGNQFIYNTRVRQNHNLILCHLMTGNTDPAIDAIDFFEKYLKPYYGNRHDKSAEVLAFRGMVNFKQGNIQNALADFGKAVPVLFREKAGEDDFLKIFRRKLIVESYMALLLQIHAAGGEKNHNTNTASQIFMLCQALNTSRVQGALGASGARSAAVDPELSDLVRKEQDASKQIDAMKNSLAELAAAPAQDKEALSVISTNLSALSKAREAFLSEIESRFPKYSEFMNPRAKEFSAIRDILKPEEAMVIFYPISDRVYLWGIPQSGPAAFGVANINNEKLKNMVRQLRYSLAPSPEIFEDIPEFDIDLAREFYTRLFKPVEAGWKNARDLLVVAPGALGQIPFSIMPESVQMPGEDRDLLYDRYRNVDWLIRKVSITRLPSVASLFTLRLFPQTARGENSFLGFGDPVFNISQVADRDTKTIGLAKRGTPIKVRGIRKVKNAKTKPVQNRSVTLGDLNRLPDTAEEILSIARVMDADLSESVFLGKRASEGNLKALNLASVNVLAFASHGLIPGDLDGLNQPAIALSAPDVTAESGEDGLLTMGEILKLELNADWVVLSACNTGAGDGAGAEAVSGLGQSFFYAGTRALLVTMWSVESTSAKKLTTGLFRFQNDNPDSSRARALQASVIDLIDNRKLLYQGKPVASYAHPFLWAPFIVVGDGG